MAYPAGIIAQSATTPRVFCGPKTGFPAATLSGLRPGDIFITTDAASADAAASILCLNGTTRIWQSVFTKP